MSNKTLVVEPLKRRIQEYNLDIENLNLSGAETEVLGLFYSTRHHLVNRLGRVSQSA